MIRAPRSSDSGGRSTALFAAVVALAFVCASPAEAQTFTRVADTQTPAPGGGGLFSLFADARAIDDGRVVFVGFHSGGSGVYSFDGTTLDVVADTTTMVPGTSDSFSTFFDVAIDRGYVAFTGGWPGPGGGCSFAGTEGVFARRFSGGPIRTVVTSVVEPENCYHAIELGQGVLAIGGGVDPVDVFHNHTESILATKRVGNANPFLTTSTPRPGGGTFAGYDQEMAIRGGGLLFNEIIPNTIGAVAGVYTIRNDGQGPQLVADQMTGVPGGQDTFNNIATSDWDGGEVGFVGRDSSNRTALYAGTSPIDLRVVVNNTTPVPGAGVNFLGLSNPMAYEGGVFAFSGYWSGGGLGLFVEDAGTVKRVLVKGDLLDGKLVDQAYCRPQQKDGSLLLVDVRFQDSSRGLYLADIAGL